MALGRLLTVATVISLTACGAHTPYYGQMSTASNCLEHVFSQSLFELGIKTGDRVVIGVSGGPDSLALAALYANWSKNSHSNCLP